MKKNSFIMFTVFSIIFGLSVNAATAKADSSPTVKNGTTTGSTGTQSDSSIVTSTWGTSPVSFDSTTGTLTVSAGTIGQAGEEIPGIAKYKVKQIILEGDVKAPQDSSGLFNGNSSPNNSSYFRNLTSISGQLNTSNVTDMSFMFYESPIKNLDVSNWNTSNVTNMDSLFQYSPIENLDVSEWDTSNVKNMSGLFFLNIATTIDVSKWDTSNVTNMSYMFALSDIENLDVSKWDTSNVTNMSYMFSQNSTQVLDVSNWDTSKVENMIGLFAQTEATTIDVSKWNTSSLRFMGAMFTGSKVTTIDLNNFDTSKLFNDAYSFEYFFEDSKVNTLKLGPKSIFRIYKNGEGEHLPEIDTSTGEYTGKWERVDPASPSSVYDSSLDFMKNYDGSMPGTYVWQRTKVAAKDLIINYQDANGKKISAQKVISGNVGDAFNESPVNIKGYTFKEVKDGAATSGTLSNDDQSITFIYEKNTPTVTTESKTVTQTIHYQYADGTKAANTYTKSLTFTRTVSTDAVTGEKTYGEWTPSQSFEAVKSPNIVGYTADKLEIKAKTVDAESKNISDTVTYTKQSSDSIDDQASKPSNGQGNQLTPTGNTNNVSQDDTANTTNIVNQTTNHNVGKVVESVLPKTAAGKVGLSVIFAIIIAGITGGLIVKNRRQKQ